ncbi:MAG: hypothetical protein HY720_20740 [Planctomycetes bacterium]|nr:hypothetical protein [Planctomycetota bacterium]
MLRSLAFLLIPPAAAALLLGFAARRPGKSGRGARWAASLAVGLGTGCSVLVAFGLLSFAPDFALDLPRIPPAERVHGLFFVALGVAALGILDAAIRAPVWIRAAMALVTVRAILWGLLQPVIANTMDAREAAFWLWGLDAGVLAVWAATDSLAARVPGPWVPAWLAAVAAGMGAALFRFAGTDVLARTAGGLAAALGALALASVGDRTSAPARGAALASVPLLAGLAAAGRFYGVNEIDALLALASVPVAAWVCRLPHLRRRLGERGALLAATGALAAALAVALSIGWREASGREFGGDQAPEAPPGVDDYSADEDYPE